MTTSSGDAGDTANTADPYARIAAWYDLEHDSFTDDIELYLEALGGERRRLSILEVGSGSGRLLAALASAGHHATGVEPSAAMRERHARRIAGLPEQVARRISLVEGSATQLHLPPDERFDVALLGQGVLGHLTRAEERTAALIALRERLRPDARLIVDVDLAGPRRLLESAGRLWLQGAWHTGARDEMVEHLMSGEPGAEPGVVDVTHFYEQHEQGGVVRRTVTHTPLALLSRGEVTLAMAHAGFALEALYGGYDMAPADDSSARLIAIARLAQAS